MPCLLVRCVPLPVWAPIGRCLGVLGFHIGTDESSLVNLIYLPSRSHGSAETGYSCQMLTKVTC